MNDVPTLGDPQSVARGMVQIVPQTRGGEVRLVGLVPKMSATPPRIRCAPCPGQHTTQLLREMPGYDDERIE